MPVRGERPGPRDPSLPNAEETAKPLGNTKGSAQRNPATGTDQLEDLRIAVSFFSGKTDTTPRRKRMRWAEFCSRIADPEHLEIAPTKEVKDRRGGFTACEFSPPYRAKENFISSVALCLDLEGEDGREVSRELPRKVQALGLVALVYTTWGNTPDSPRYRVVIPLSRKVRASEYRRLVRAVLEVLDEPYDKHASLHPEQMMFLPTVPTEEARGWYERYVFEGEVLPVEEWLATAPPDEDDERPAERRREGGVAYSWDEDPFDVFIGCCEKLGKQIDWKSADEAMVQCPVHSDGKERTPSLHATRDPVKGIWLHCFKCGHGLKAPEFFDAVGLDWGAVMHPSSPEEDFGSAATAAADGGDEQPSWRPLALADYADGTYVPPEPTLMPREDGPCLLYPGKVHSFHGEPESGKSMLAYAEIARLLGEGQRCALIDFESDPATVVDRLLKLGAPRDAVVGSLDYIRPEVRPQLAPAEAEWWDTLLSRPYALVVIDGVTEAFAVFGVKSVDNDEVTRWGREVPKRIAHRTGAAVVVIDHVTKSADGRSRFAIGAQAKMSYLDGPAYSVEVVSPMGKGLCGAVRLRVGKDRPGGVRNHCGPWRKTDRTQPAAYAVFDSETDEEAIGFRLLSWREDPTSAGETREEMEQEDVRLQADRDLMREITEQLEKAGKPLTANQLYCLVSGGRTRISEMARALRDLGCIKMEDGPRSSICHSFIRHPVFDDEDLLGLESIEGRES